MNLLADRKLHVILNHTELSFSQFQVPCARGRLYVPERRRCYRPGTPEPCPLGEVVAFDFDARPALDGLSHNGVCACSSGSCPRREVNLFVFFSCISNRVVAAIFDLMSKNVSLLNYG